MFYGNPGGKCLICTIYPCQYHIHFTRRFFVFPIAIMNQVRV